MNKKSTYIGNCTEKSADFVYTVMDKAKPITYKTLLLHVNWRKLKEIFPNYDWGKQKDLKLKDDYTVSFYRSPIGNKWYYIVKWSGIEFFFVLLRNVK